MEDLQKDSPVTKFVIIVAYANYNSVIGVQSAGEICNATITGVNRRHFCNAAVDKQDGGACNRRRCTKTGKHRWAHEVLSLRALFDTSAMA